MGCSERGGEAREGKKRERRRRLKKDQNEPELRSRGELGKEYRRIHRLDKVKESG
jgi:hypothetical protein